MPHEGRENRITSDLRLKAKPEVRVFAPTNFRWMELFAVPTGTSELGCSKQNHTGLAGIFFTGSKFCQVKDIEVFNQTSLPPNRAFLRLRNSLFPKRA
jgi:hypothetical protein